MNGTGRFQRRIEPGRIGLRGRERDWGVDFLDWGGDLNLGYD